MSQPDGPVTTLSGPPLGDAHSPPPADGPATAVPLGRSVPAVLVSIGVVALLCDLAVHSRAGGAAAAAAVVVLCVALVRVGWVARRGGRVLLTVAVGVSALLVLRVSPWLVVLDLATIAALLALACSAEHHGRFGDTRFATVGRRMCSTAGAMVVAVDPLARAVAATAPGAGGGARAGARSVARGLLLAVPLMAVIGISLASADAVFASLFDVELRLGRWVGHVAVLLGAAVVATGWFVQSSRPPVSHPPRSVTIGAVEATVVMAGLTAVEAAFAWSQLLVARRGPGYVAATTGLTYAEYARSGFFQLLWVAGATAVVLLVVRAVVVTASPGATRCIAATGALAALLTLVVVHAAIVRLDLYEDAFGLTLLRYASSAVAWWLGAAFVVIAAWFLLGGRGRRDWLPTSLGLLSLAVVVGLNLADPEATVMRHNLERVRSGDEFDADYALRLSDDSVPTLVASIDLLPAEQVDALRAELCRAERRGPTRWTLAESAAARSLDELCD